MIRILRVRYLLMNLVSLGASKMRSEREGRKMDTIKSRRKRGGKRGRGEGERRRGEREEREGKRERRQRERRKEERVQDN